MPNKWAGAIQSLSGERSGMGAGNRPYAPGLMSGKSPMSDAARQLYQNLSGEHSKQQMQASMASPPTGGSQGGGQPQPPQWTPESQQHVLTYLMSLLNSPSGSKMTTTGGFIQKGKQY